MEKKMTKKEMFTLIATLNESNQEIVDFCNHEIELLEKKKSNGNAKANEKMEQSVELVYMRKKEELLCYGDANRIKQVFINVIDNALKYNQAGGQILIEQALEDDCVQISVSDTGVGIAAQDLDRVKEKFYKANKQVRGSGIGLAVADEIIKQHNGLLLLESTEGVGTTVKIVLPLLKEGENNEL